MSPLAAFSCWPGGALFSANKGEGQREREREWRRWAGPGQRGRPRFILSYYYWFLKRRQKRNEGVWLLLGKRLLLLHVGGTSCSRVCVCVCLWPAGPLGFGEWPDTAHLFLFLSPILGQRGRVGQRRCATLSARVLCAVCCVFFMCACACLDSITNLTTICMLLSSFCDVGDL